MFSNVATIATTVALILLVAVAFVVRGRQSTIVCAAAFVAIATLTFLSAGATHRSVAKLVINQYDTRRSDYDAEGCPVGCSAKAAGFGMHSAFYAVESDRWYYLASTVGLAVLAIRAARNRTP